MAGSRPGNLAAGCPACAVGIAGWRTHRAVDRTGALGKPHPCLKPTMSEASKSDRNAAMADFLARSGWGAASISPLPGDASTRYYSRLALGDRKAMLMDQPQYAEAPTAPAG